MERYLGTTHGWRGDRDVSPEWCAGQVVGACRLVYRPHPTEFSLKVMKRIKHWKAPSKTIADILGWPKKEVA